MPPFGMYATMPARIAGPRGLVHSNPISKRSHTSQRSCEKNNLTPRRQGAKTRKEQLLCFPCAFYDFAPLREMLLLIHGLFYSFKTTYAPLAP